MRVFPNHPFKIIFVDRIFHERNHPAITPMTMETSIDPEIFFRHPGGVCRISRRASSSSTHCLTANHCSRGGKAWKIVFDMCIMYVIILYIYSSQACAYQKSWLVNSRGDHKSWSSEKKKSESKLRLHACSASENGMRHWISMNKLLPSGKLT